MDKRIFQLVYDPARASEEEVKSFADALHRVFENDILLVVPESIRLKEIGLDELVSMRDRITDVICDKLASGGHNG